ncbi:unnamed protein product, partial [Timema podura]|nr:unnamed protein product [Timema podura]
VIQRRDDFGEPRENFNRDWADYKNGFGDPAKELWMGNENIYMLTNNEDYMLRIELEDFEGNKSRQKANVAQQRLTLHERAKLASRYQVWQSVVQVPRWWRSSHGPRALLDLKTIKNCHEKLIVAEVVVHQHPVLKKDLSFRPWKPHYCQELSAEDCDHRMVYGEIMLGWYNDWAQLFDNIIWSDEAIFHVTHPSRVIACSRFAQYSHFKIYSEGEYYKLEIDGYDGNAGDSLNDPWYGSNNSPFSTYNRSVVNRETESDLSAWDNDRSSLNCASMLKGGWWWKSCGRGLNGLYLNDPQDLTARQGIVWFRWRGWDYTLKKAVMMIKPRGIIGTTTS